MSRFAPSGSPGQPSIPAQNFLDKKEVVLFGTDACPDCQRAKKILSENNIAYEYINLEKNPECIKAMLKINGGLQLTPTILFPNGKVLAEPTDQELKDTLAQL